MGTKTRLALTCVFLLAPLAPASAIEILRFDVSILLDRESSFLVTETIEVDFGDLRKHGIFRTIPIEYERTETLAGFNLPARYSIRLRVLDVDDGENQPIPFTASRQGHDIFIRIGDPNRFVSGRVTYAITYRVQRAINRFENHDELYWNVTGTEWEWPIHSASVRVPLPDEMDIQGLMHETFTGRWGSRQTTATEDVGDRDYVARVENLGPGEGLTVVLGFPKGILQPPSAWQEFWWSIAGNILFFLVGLAPIMALGILWWRYLRIGRDPGSLTPIVVQYEPPADLSPAEMGSLVDETIDTPDIVSTVIDLAVRGYLKIHEEKTTKLLFLSQTDYRFERLEPAEGVLSGHELAFMNALFSSGNSVMLSSLKEKFYTSIPGIRKAITKQLLQKDLFPSDPERVRTFYRGVGLAAAALPVGLGFILNKLGWVTMNLPPSTGIFIIFAVFCGVLTLIIIRFFAKAMPSKTPKGARLARYCLGFKEFVERVEQDRIERMAKDDPALFERVLPYAVVLGVADEWAERFEGLLTQPPNWYDSPSTSGGHFYPRAMVSDLGHSMQTMGSTFTSRPSGSGGGGSGFGGGGFSGGGSGGGGGGSW